MAVQQIQPIAAGTALGAFGVGLSDDAPMHLSGAVQAQGALLVLDRRGPSILAASTSIASYTGFEARDIIGHRAEWGTGIDGLGDAFKRAGVERAGGAHVALDVALPWMWQDHAILAYQHGINYIVEMVPGQEIAPGQFRDHFREAEETIQMLATVRTREEAADLVAVCMARVTGFETVAVTAQERCLASFGPLAGEETLAPLGTIGGSGRALDLVLTTRGSIAKLLPGSHPFTGLPYDLSGAYLCAPEPDFLLALQRAGAQSALRFMLPAGSGGVVCISCRQHHPAQEAILLAGTLARALDRRFAELRT